MADWDQNSPELLANLIRVLSDIRNEAGRRTVPAATMAATWQSEMMRGLTPPDPRYVGRFRGEPGLEDCVVQIGQHFGSPPEQVAAALEAFQRKLQRTVAELDRRYPPDGELDEDGLGAVIELAAWVHSEWVRIHPLANGNGRTARLWANFIAMRYGLPPFARLRPRPDEAEYGEAARAAMEGDWQKTVPVFQKLLRSALRGD